ncbi:hypothetical protein U1Q18_037873 [Sarracenia purpurea var. burkii]
MVAHDLVDRRSGDQLGSVSVGLGKDDGAAKEEEGADPHSEKKIRNDAVIFPVVSSDLGETKISPSDVSEGEDADINEEEDEEKAVSNLIQPEDNVVFASVELPKLVGDWKNQTGFRAEGSHLAPQVSAKMPKTNSGPDTVSIDAPLNPVATRGSYASHSGAGEWPRAVNDGNEGQNGHEASKSWASIVAGDNYEKLDGGVKHVAEIPRLNLRCGSKLEFSNQAPLELLILRKPC